MTQAGIYELRSNDKIAELQLIANRDDWGPVVWTAILRTQSPSGEWVTAQETTSKIEYVLIRVFDTMRNNKKFPPVWKDENSEINVFYKQVARAMGRRVGSWIKRFTACKIQVITKISEQEVE